MLIEIVCEYWVEFGYAKLNRDADVVQLGFGDPGWMGCRDTVDEVVAFGSITKTSASVFDMLATRAYTGGELGDGG